MPSLSSSLRYWHTLKYLKPVQFYGRLWFRLARPAPDLSDAAPMRVTSGRWQHPVRRECSMMSARVLRFLGETGDLSVLGWDNPRASKLWRYNLHYFDDLNAQGAPDRKAWHRQLITDWITDNPPGLGSGWEPYPTSLRIVNWIKWALDGNTLSEQAHHSLAIQARWLTKRLEWHLLGNHLFANAKALMFAGLYFEGTEGARFRQIAARILAREIPEQILPDGGQFELTPMYHAIALEDILDLSNLFFSYSVVLTAQEHALQTLCTKRVPDMVHWLRCMSHPDGQISFFNDAAFGIAPENSELFALAARLGLTEPNPRQTRPMTHLRDSGYARLESGPAVLLADLAQIGPDYLPGHAHADTLSFELSVFEQRLFVNSGTSLYGIGKERLHQRSTPAHNTVTVAGQNSSEVWSGFRVARRAVISEVYLKYSDGVLVAHGSHDGYQRLPGAPRHKRQFSMSKSSLTISDLVVPANPAEARYHLHPDIKFETTQDGTWTFVFPGGQILHWIAPNARVESTSWHPRFGESHPTTCLVVPLRDGRAEMILSWS